MNKLVSLVLLQAFLFGLTIHQNIPATPALNGVTSFQIGPGWADVIPHQIIRTADDRVYLFAMKGNYSNTLLVYWTVQAGLPSTATNFSGSGSVTNSTNLISVAPVYDGGHIIHVLTNDDAGDITDRPFDTLTNQFKPAKVLDMAGATPAHDFVGTAGIAAGFDASGVLHLAYWSSGWHITYRAYTYNVSLDELTLAAGPTQLDASGKASHPVLAVSPKDGSVTAAWISQVVTPTQILATTKTSGGWGSLEIVNSAPVWVDNSSGASIDQGSSLVIGTDGTRHLAYIESYGINQPIYPYGRIHYVTSSGSGWTDQYIGSYSHDPAIAINAAGQVSIIGHGYLNNATCTSTNELCLYAQTGGGTWATPQVLIAPQGNQSFDASPSVKWSAVGYNRPETIEFIISQVSGGYDAPLLYYGRLDPVALNDKFIYLPIAMK